MAKADMSNKPKIDDKRSSSFNISIIFQNASRFLLLSILCWILKKHFYSLEPQSAVQVEKDRLNSVGMDLYHVSVEYGPILVGGLGALVSQHTRSHVKRYPQDRIFIWYPWTDAAKLVLLNECYFQRQFMNFSMFEPISNQTTLAEIHSCRMNYYNVTILFADLPEHKMYHAFMETIKRSGQVYHKSFDCAYYFSQIVAKAMEIIVLNMPKSQIIRKSVLHLHTGRFGFIASQLRHPNKDPEIASILKQYLFIVVIWHDYYYEHNTAEAEYSLDALSHLVHHPQLYLNSKNKTLVSLVTSSYIDASICVSQKMRDGLANGTVKVVQIHDRWWPMVKQHPFLAVTNNMALNEMRHNPWKSTIQILPNGPLSYENRIYNNLLDVKKDAKKLFVDIAKVKLRNLDLLDKTWVIYTGRFDEMKGSLLLAAASKAIENLPNAYLVVASNGRLTDRTLRSSITKNNFILLDSPLFESQYGTLLRLASDIAFIPSRQEAFGLVGVEAFLYGQMLVTSRAVGLLEYTREFDNQELKAVENNSNWRKMVRDCVSQWTVKAPSHCYHLHEKSPFSFNGVQFNVHLHDDTAIEQDEAEVIKALNIAIPLYQSMTNLQREQFLWHQVSQAGPFVMERSGGMVDQYRKIYESFLK